MTTRADMDQISDRLRTLSRDGGSIEAAQVSVIGLDEIREAAGPRWERMRERVRTGSISILSRMIGADDVIIPAGDGFLVILAEAPPGQVQQRCQQMRDALLSFYLGEETLASLRPQVNSRSLSAQGLTDLIARSRDDEGEETRKPLVAKSRDDEIGCAPVYVTHDARVGALLATPVAHERSGRRFAYNPDFIFDGRHHRQQDFLELDVAVLDKALTTANALRADDQICPIGVTVHVSTLQQRRARETYLNWLAEIDPALKRTFFIMIAEIERGTPLISIGDWCVALRMHVSQVWLDFHLTDHAIGSVGSTGARAAGFNLPIYSGAQKEPRASRLRDHISFWSKSLAAQGMRLVVHGFQDAAFAEMAGPLGVDLLTSDAQWPFAFRAEDAAAFVPSSIAA